MIPTGTNTRTVGRFSLFSTGLGTGLGQKTPVVLFSPFLRRVWVGGDFKITLFFNNFLWSVRLEVIWGCFTRSFPWGHLAQKNPLTLWKLVQGQGKTVLEGHISLRFLVVEWSYYNGHVVFAFLVLLTFLIDHLRTVLCLQTQNGHKTKDKTNSNPQKTVNYDVNQNV